jgi:folate-binding protein YgfZ
MTNALTSPLADRSLLRIGGEDAPHFLQNLVTCNVESLAIGDGAFGALLTPQGKILFDFFLVRTAEGYLADIASSLVEDFARRLTFYRLRAKVTIERETSLGVHAVLGGQAPQTSGMVIADPRLPQMGHRIYESAAPDLPQGDYAAHRIGLGMPQGGEDYAYGDAFPHEALMDQFGGVDFTKGCYVGQEVVSRMQHRGTARSRVVMVTANGPLPPQGADMFADGRPCGTMGSSVGVSSGGSQGLAMLRLDRVGEAMAKGAIVSAGDVAVIVSIQPWAKFGWPQERTGAQG